jgi:hypothetical protein
MTDQMQLTLLLGRHESLNVMIAVDDARALLKLRRGDVHVCKAELGPAARAAGAELTMRRSYRGATISGYRFGRVNVLESGPTDIVPTPSIDGGLHIEIAGPAMETWG